MNKRVLALSLAVSSALTVLAVPAEAEASTNFELRKKVIGISGIMGITDVYSSVTRAQFAQMTRQSTATPRPTTAPCRCLRMCRRKISTPPISASPRTRAG